MVNVIAKRVVAEEIKKSNIFCRKDKTGKLVLNYYGLMVAGAVARATSATAVHPLNVIKTMLQMKNGKVPPLTWNVLSRGAGSQFIMSIPHGAINFAITETAKSTLASIATNSTISNAITTVIPKNIFNNILDFLSSAVSTFICSIISTPQMVLTDRIMGGVYENFFVACYRIAKDEGIRGFYLGWLPALLQKIPSYALTWMFFQQLKQSFLLLVGRVGTTFENTLLGSAAAAFACCVMIPIDTVKTRIVMSQRGGDTLGVIDTLQSILKNEGVFALYKALPPRLLSVVPMIGIQFGVYELMKRALIGEPLSPKESLKNKVNTNKKVKSE
jgi:solute carrier family 25 S-adenosylmethionine transporter 26